MACATEAGGASNLRPIIEEFCDIANFSTFCSGGAQSTFQQAQVPTHDSRTINSKSEATTLLKTIEPQVVLVGRGLDLDSPERFLTVSARELGIPSVGIIDEWYDYRLNYIDALGELRHLPDIICCPDEQARDEAILDGLPSERLRVTGSPALSELIDTRESYKQNPPPRPKLLTDNCLRPVVVFLSEAISISQSHETERTLKINRDDSLGYDEHRVRTDLANILGEKFDTCTVLEKLHPSADPGHYSPINMSKGTWACTPDVNLTQLLWWADIVVGMRSAGLLASVLLGIPTVSYQPNLKEKNRCTAVRKGLVSCCLSPRDLRLWLENYRLGKSREFSGRPNYASKAATKAVFSIIENIV